MVRRLPTRQAARLVLIGAGYFAQFHAEAWQRVSGVRLVAVADAKPGRALSFARQHNVAAAYESAEEALTAEQPDLVDIATRPEAHLLLTRLACAHQAHVLCQKPMAPTFAECVAMCDACDQADVRLLIHENWRWQPWYREVKRLLDAGVVGRPTQVSFFWRTGDGRGPEPYPLQPYFKEMPRLLVYETLVHILDTYRYLLGDMTIESCELGRVNPAIVGEDLAWIQVRFENGVQGRIDGNRITGPTPAPVAMGSLVLEGDAATLRLSADGRLWLARNDQDEEPIPFEIPTMGYRGDSVFATQEHLWGALRSGQPSESDGRDYLRTVELVEDCYRMAGAIVAAAGPA